MPMSGPELAAAYVSISLSTGGLGRDVKQELGAAGDEGGRVGGERAGRSMLGSMGRMLSTGVKAIGLTAGVTVGALLGKGLADSFAQSDATTKFKQSLDFAGITKGQIDQATKLTQGYADKTVFDLSTVQNTAAQLAANGVKDFTGLTEAAGNLTAVAGGNADSFRSVAMAMTQTVGAGKLTTENWNQIADAIPGASGVLQEAMRKNGAFTGDFRDAMAKSQITAEEFNKALMEVGTRPIAVEAAKSTATFEGAMGNMMATITGGFAGLLNKVKPQLTGFITAASGLAQKGFDAVSKAFDGDFSGLKAIGQKIIDAIIKHAPDMLGGGMKLALKLIDGILNALPKVLAAAADLIAALAQGIAKALPRIAAVAGDILVSLVNALVKALPQVINAGVKAIGSLIEGITKALPTVLTAAVAILTALISGIVTNLPMLIDAALGLVTQLVSSLAGLLPQIVDAGLQLLTGVISGIVDNLPKIIDAAATLVSTIVTKLSDLLPDLVQGGLDLLLGVISGIIDNLPKIVTTVGTLVTKIVTAVTDNLPKIIAAGLTLLLAVIDGIINNLPKLIKTGLDLVLKLVDAIVKAIPALLDAAIQIITGIIGYLSDPKNLLNLAKAALSIVTELVKALGKLGWKLLEGAISLVGTFVEKIGEGITKAWQGFIDLGKKVIDAIVAGIKATGSAIWNAITSLFTGSGKSVTIPVTVQATADSLKNVISNPGSTNSTVQALKGYYGGGRASGGSVDPSQFYTVGENGPELFVPTRSGRIVSNDALAAAAASSSSLDTSGIESRLDRLLTAFEAIPRRTQVFARAGGH